MYEEKFSFMFYSFFKKLLIDREIKLEKMNVSQKKKVIRKSKDKEEDLEL